MHFSSEQNDIMLSAVLSAALVFIHCNKMLTLFTAWEKNGLCSLIFSDIFQQMLTFKLILLIWRLILDAFKGELELFSFVQTIGLYLN